MKGSPDEFMFTFANTRDAIEGEKKLLAGGLSVAVMPLPDRIGAGCGIALRVVPADLERARSLLGTAFRELYAISPAEGPSPDRAASGKKVFTWWNP
jgi:hypothetical protein